MTSALNCVGFTESAATSLNSDFVFHTGSVMHILLLVKIYAYRMVQMITCVQLLVSSLVHGNQMHRMSVSLRYIWRLNAQDFQTLPEENFAVHACFFCH
jgi:hypothetical protein